MKKIICIFAALLTVCGAFSKENDDRKSSFVEKKVYQMGEIYGKDSSKVSGRSFPKRLVMPKGAMGVGLQGLWVKMDASNAQAFALVTGVEGSASFGNVAPSFMWAYANNNALGLRLAYTNIGLNIPSGQIRLFSDDLTFNLGGLGTKINSYSCSVFNRSWFGLDKRGRFALFADVDLGYSFSQTRGDNTKASTNSVSLVFSPGLEIFVMNELSVYFSLGFANLSYNNSKCYVWTPANDATTDGKWEYQGSSEGFKAQVRLNLLDLRFGLAYYF